MRNHRASFSRRSTLFDIINISRFYNIACDARRTRFRKSREVVAKKARDLREHYIATRKWSSLRAAGHKRGSLESRFAVSGETPHVHSIYVSRKYFLIRKNKTFRGIYARALVAVGIFREEETPARVLLACTGHSCVAAVFASSLVRIVTIMRMPFPDDNNRGAKKALDPVSDQMPARGARQKDGCDARKLAKLNDVGKIRVLSEERRGGEKGVL